MGKWEGSLQTMSPIRKIRLYESVVDQIKLLITQSQLRPGDRLPPERTIAEHLGVSRPSVRDAIRVLDIMGLVEVRPGGGTFLKEFGISRYVRSIREAASLLIEFEEQALIDLWEVRGPIEAEAAALACIRAADDDIRKASSSVEEMESHLRNPEGFARADFEFHEIIVNSGRNKVMVLIMDSLADLRKKHHRKVYNLICRDEGTALRTLETHEAILGAIKARDEAQARAAVAKHMSLSKNMLVLALREEQEGLQE